MKKLDIFLMLTTIVCFNPSLSGGSRKLTNRQNLISFVDELYYVSSSDLQVKNQLTKLIQACSNKYKAMHSLIKKCSKEKNTNLLGFCWDALEECDNSPSDIINIQISLLKKALEDNNHFFLKHTSITFFISELEAYYKTTLYDFACNQEWEQELLEAIKKL